LPLKVVDDLTQRHLRVSSRSEAVLLFEQICLEDRSEYEDGCGLHHAVPNRRDAERTPTATALGDPHAQQGLWAILPRSQLLLKISKPSLSPLSFDVCEADSIGTGGAAVCTASPPGFSEHVVAEHLVPEAVETTARFSLRFRM
jgi:hypothetical protein